jgi:hypothetical protein
MDWTVRVLHGFWDSWLHERDVLLARGLEHPTDGEATLALAGRSPGAALGGLPANSRAALSHMADFFNTPVPDQAVRIAHRSM